METQWTKWITQSDTANWDGAEILMAACFFFPLALQTGAIDLCETKLQLKQQMWAIKPPDTIG